MSTDWIDDDDLPAEREKCVAKLVTYHYSYEDAVFIAEKMIDNDQNTEYVIKYVLRDDILNNNRYGWVDRNGRFYGCAYAAHEILCMNFGWESVDLERKGWIRISDEILYVFRLSYDQKKFLKKFCEKFNFFDKDAIDDRGMDEPPLKD